MGSAAHFLVQEILRRHGMDPAAREVTILGVGTTANRYAALQSGTVDATNLTPPFNFKAQDAGLRELLSFVKEEYLVEPGGAIVVRDQLLQSDPLLLQRFIRGTLKGLLHIRHNRAGTIPILARLMKIQEDMAAKIYDLVFPGSLPTECSTRRCRKRFSSSCSRCRGSKSPSRWKKSMILLR